MNKATSKKSATTSAEQLTTSAEQSPGVPADKSLSLSENDIQSIDGVRERLEQALREYKDRYNLSNATLVSMLYPYVKTEQQLSKILAIDGNDKRHATLNLACAMRRKLGIDVQAIFDGDNVSRACVPLFPPVLREAILSWKMSTLTMFLIMRAIFLV